MYKKIVNNGCNLNLCIQWTLVFPSFELEITANIITNTNISFRPLYQVMV